MPEIRETEIRSVIYQKPNQTWARVRTTDKLNESWSGEMVEDITPGTWIKAEGYVGPPKGHYRPEFIVTRVIQIETERPDIPKAWMQWRLPDIGEVRAEQLSAQYGRALPDVLDDAGRAATALAAVKGLTPARVKKILEVYRDYPGELRLAIWLSEPNPEEHPDTGLKWAAIKVVIEEFRKRGGPRAAVEAVEEDPYELMALKDITFNSVDALAEGLGLPENDPRRMRGFVWEKLDELAGSKGDCVEPRSNIVAGLRKYGYSETDLNKILNESSHFRFGLLGAQLTKIRNEEVAVAEHVREAMSRKIQQEITETIGIPEWLDKSQRAAVENLLQVPIAILTGGPGTGKTTVLKTALEQMERRGERIKLASPTGKAAKRMTETTGRPATTIHKLLKWKPEGFDYDATNPIPDADVVVVDEASMLDIWLAASLFSALAPGTRLILVGDVDQLPPVGPGQPLQDLLESKLVPVFRLTEVHRQAAKSWVVQNAPRILEGKLPSLQSQSDFDFIKIEDSSKIIEAAIAIYRQAREDGPAVEKQLQVLTPVKNSGAGVAVLNTEIQKAMNPNASDSRFSDDHVQGSGESKIYAGDKVFYTSNTVVDGLVNGSMGVVESVEVTAKGKTAVVRFDGDINPETGDELFELHDDEIRPLMLAYAMTVHKAQGSEWGHVVVIADPVHRFMSRRLLYTAVTRTNKNLLILGTEGAVAWGAKNNRNENRATLLQQRLRGEQV